MIWKIFHKKKNQTNMMATFNSLQFSFDCDDKMNTWSTFALTGLGGGLMVILAIFKILKNRNTNLLVDSKKNIEFVSFKTDDYLKSY